MKTAALGILMECIGGYPSSAIAYDFASPPPDSYITVDACIRPGGESAYLIVAFNFWFHPDDIVKVRMKHWKMIDITDFSMSLEKIKDQIKEAVADVQRPDYVNNYNL